MGTFRALLKIAGLGINGLLHAVPGLVIHALFFLPKGMRWRGIAVIGSSCYRVTGYLCGIRYRLAGDYAPNPKALVVANHIGTPDVLIMGGLFHAFFVSKSEIGGWPFIGQLARIAATIFIDRSRRHQTGSMVSQIQARLEQDCSVIVFPEGGATDGSEVTPFKSSTFEAAVRANRPVLPVAIRYHGEQAKSIACWYRIPFGVHIWAFLKHPRLEATVYILPPIEGTGDRKALAEKCREMIREKLDHEMGKAHV